MSQVTHPRLQPAGWVRAHRLVALAALLAVFATAAVLLVLAVGGNESTSSVSSQPTADVRAGGRPDESRIAAAIGSAGDGSAAATRPDESAIASAISGR
jgi:hypothetical protein